MKTEDFAKIMESKGIAPKAIFFEEKEIICFDFGADDRYFVLFLMKTSKNDVVGNRTANELKKNLDFILEGKFDAALNKRTYVFDRTKWLIVPSDIIDGLAYMEKMKGIFKVRSIKNNQKEFIEHLEKHRQYQFIADKLKREFFFVCKTFYDSLQFLRFQYDEDKQTDDVFRLRQDPDVRYENFFGKTFAFYPLDRIRNFVENCDEKKFSLHESLSRQIEEHLFLVSEIAKKINRENTFEVSLSFEGQEDYVFWDEAPKIGKKPNYKITVKKMTDKDLQIYLEDFDLLTSISNR